VQAAPSVCGEIGQRDRDGVLGLVDDGARVVVAGAFDDDLFQQFNLIFDFFAFASRCAVFEDPHHDYREENTRYGVTDYYGRHMRILRSGENFRIIK
jgi:hypothetical protein